MDKQSKLVLVIGSAVYLVVAFASVTAAHLAGWQW